ncbi:WD40 repeat domain-containing serine/threonine protein kinase [Paludisphaera rhizosphaerae]|uniref:WD40 repeat domain-containing serine/threonine protein kinase n=1 Tax=Paludisphaera rhizosphaerae TaxID=2711216 RepID=UPI0013EA5E3C|nr:protein kinase [Paludisphaera rhizosphaerae]
MSMTPPPEDRDDSDVTPTLPDGVPYHVLDNLDEHEVAEMRAAFERLEAEPNRTSDGTPTRLEALGPFRDLVEIGRGGMGRVYRTLDPATGEDVAVKVTAPALKHDLSVRRRFLREARAAQILQHPGIVPCRGWGEDDGGCYIVSDLCDGPNLETWLKARKGSVPAREAARIVRVLAEAIAHAHSQGVLHRDLKPSNVLLPGATVNSDAEDLSPRLTDFGLARAIDQDAPAGDTPTATGLILGSPPYMAPEQAAGGGHEVDRRTDVYGLGAMLYAVLTGRPPFRGETPRETIKMVINDDPIPVRVLRPGVPKALETIALTCLEKQKDNRYRTAEDLCEDLDAFLENRLIKAPGISRAERFRRWSRRRPKATTALVAGVAALAVLIAAIAAWTYELTNHVKELRRQRDVIARLGYDATIQSAGRDLEDGRLGVAQSKLAELVPGPGMPDFREFAWSLLWNSACREARMLSDQLLSLVQPSISPSGRFLATGSDNSTLKVYDLDQDRVLWSVDTPNRVLALRPTFSPDDQLMAVCFSAPEGEASSRSFCVEVRNLRTGEVVATRAPFLPGKPIWQISLLDDGRLITTILDVDESRPGTVDVLIWSIRNRLLEDHGALRLVGCRAISPDGRRFAAEKDEGFLAVYDLDREWLPGHERIPVEDVCRVVFDEQARRMAVGFERAGEVRVVDTETGLLLMRAAGFSTMIDQIAFHPSANALLVHEKNQEVRLVEPSRGVDLQVFGPTNSPGVGTIRMLFSQDGSVFFVHRSEYMAADHLEVHSSADGVKFGESPGRVKAQMGDWFLRSGGRQELVYGLGRRVWSWDWRASITSHGDQAVTAHRDEGWAIDYSPNGQFIATGADDDGDPVTIKIWEALSKKEVRSWREANGTAADLAFSPDGKLIATVHLSRDRAVRVRETAGGDPFVFEMPEEQWARSVEFDPTGELLLAGGDKGDLMAWNVRSRKLVWSNRLSSPRALALKQLRIHDLEVDAGRARLASASDDGSVRLHELATGEVVAHYQAPAAVYSLALSPDGRVLAAADREGAIHILDADTCRLKRILYGDESDLRAIAFSPDSRTLAAGGLDRVVHLWDPETSQELLSLRGPQAQINGLAFSPDGETLAAIDHSGMLWFWRGSRRAP